MQAITREVFGRLRSLDPVAEEQRMRQEEEEASAELKLALSPTTVTNPLPSSDNLAPGQAQDTQGAHEPEAEREYPKPIRRFLVHLIICSPSLWTPNRRRGPARIARDEPGVLRME